MSSKKPAPKKPAPKKTESKTSSTANSAVLSYSTNKECSFFVTGKQYLVRTATNYTVGELADVNDEELLFTKAAWVVSTGRFFDSLKSGEFAEVEPFPDDVIVSRGAIVDATIFRGKLPLSQK